MMKRVATVVAGAGLVIVAAGCSTTASTTTMRWGYDGPMGVFYRFQDGYVESMKTGGPIGPIAVAPQGPAGIEGRGYSADQSAPVGMTGYGYTGEAHYTFPGAVGAQGQTGAVGAQGERGVVGERGVIGATGQVGEQGTQGVPGVDGKVVPK
jgi:hypothetical protein